MSWIQQGFHIKFNKVTMINNIQSSFKRKEAIVWNPIHHDLIRGLNGNNCKIFGKPQ